MTFGKFQCSRIEQGLLIYFFAVECGESKNKPKNIETSSWSFSSFSLRTKKYDEEEKRMKKIFCLCGQLRLPNFLLVQRTLRLKDKSFHLLFCQTWIIEKNKLCILPVVKKSSFLKFKLFFYCFFSLPWLIYFWILID